MAELRFTEKTPEYVRKSLSEFVKDWAQSAYRDGWKIPSRYASKAMPIIVRAGVFGAR